MLRLGLIAGGRSKTVLSATPNSRNDDKAAGLRGMYSAGPGGACRWACEHSAWPSHLGESAGTVINIKELWAEVQVDQCCTDSFITPTHLQVQPWQDSALSEPTSPHLH